jgi:hypothetical protein
MRSRRALLAALIMASLGAYVAAAQTPIVPPADTPAATTPGADEHVPEPYRPEEFPAWALDLRRAEVVFFGSLPFSLFFTFEAYDLGRFVASGFDPLQAPWPMRAGSEIGAGYTPAEKGWLIVSAITVSLGVSVADYLLGRPPRSRENR